MESVIIAGALFFVTVPYLDILFWGDRAILHELEKWGKVSTLMVICGTILFATSILSSAFSVICYLISPTSLQPTFLLHLILAALTGFCLLMIPALYFRITHKKSQ